MQIKPENSIDIDSYERFMFKECWIMVLNSDQMHFQYLKLIFFFFVTLLDVRHLHAFSFL